MPSPSQVPTLSRVRLMPTIPMRICTATAWTACRTLSLTPTSRRHTVSLSVVPSSRTSSSSSSTTSALSRRTVLPTGIRQPQRPMQQTRRPIRRVHCSATWRPSPSSSRTSTAMTPARPASILAVSPTTSTWPASTGTSTRTITWLCVSTTPTTRSGLRRVPRHATLAACRQPA